MLYWGNIYSRFSSSSEANASELLENQEIIIIWNDFDSILKSASELKRNLSNTDCFNISVFIISSRLWCTLTVGCYELQMGVDYKFFSKTKMCKSMERPSSLAHLTKIILWVYDLSRYF